MPLFKSKEERRIERDIQLRKTINLFRKQIRGLNEKETAYIKKAKEARQINAQSQYELSRKALKQTLRQRKRFEQQLLTIEIAAQMKDQAESHAEFAKALKGVSKTIAEMFGTADLVQTQKDFEMAMAKAHSMEERMDIFLESSSDSMFSELEGDDELVSDKEIDELIEAEAVHDESQIDSEIDKGLQEIEKELSKEKK